MAPLAGTGLALTLNHLRKTFEGRPVIADFSLQIERGEILAILGPSGCGKSTLLRLIAQLLKPDGGSLSVQPDQPFQTSFVFQDAQLLPWKSALENVALPLQLRHTPGAERDQRARKALQTVGLLEAERLYPSQMSGGMRMRVSVARALVTNPGLLLLDEPFAALDEITRFRLEEALRELWLTRGLTVILVTHSISEAAFVSNRAIVLARREGLIKLDHRSRLPHLRDMDIRTEAVFADEMRVLLKSMEEE